MGKILSGILGPISGRIGGVVGARWKSVPYLRSYVVPGASRTDLQSDQRDRFGYMVAAAKPFVGIVFNAFYDKFLSRESGFNRCIKTNIPTTPNMPPVALLMVTDGPLYPGSGFVSNYATTTGVCNIVWGTENGVDGSAGDVAIAWIRNKATNLVKFAGALVRGDGSTSITGLPTGGVNTDYEGGVFFAKMKDTLVLKISRNLVGACSAA